MTTKIVAGGMVIILGEDNIAPCYKKGLNSCVS
jgi:hypothetical protein